MNLKGRRIHFIGSVSPKSDEAKLNYVHALVRDLTTALATQGAVFVVPFDGEPLLEGQTSGPSTIFDWTVAATLENLLNTGTITATGSGGHLIATVSTYKNNQTNRNIPSHRRPIYEALSKAGAIYTVSLEPGITAGALQRQRIARMSDIMIGISGGQGVEHLASEFSPLGKPVIPLDIDLGSINADGSGGASRLYGRALAKPENFISVENGKSAAHLLTQISTNNGNEPSGKVVNAVLKLIEALTPPRVFYVRLMNPGHKTFPHVESFFRNTVDTAVTDFGFQPYQVDTAKTTRPWINQAIFDDLHHSSVVVADFTALRPNCFVELGYAFGNRQKVILTARRGTKIPFDIAPIQIFLWSEKENPSDQIRRFKEHWNRNIDMPALVNPRLAQ